MNRNISFDGNTHLTYNSLDELVSSENNNGEITNYVYNPSGIRVEKSSSGSVSRYINKEFEISESFSGETLESKSYTYIFFGNKKLATIENISGNEHMIFHHEDHLGGGNIDFDASGSILQVVDYLPYGEVRNKENSSDYNNKYLFGGKELDSESDLQYFEARYFNPKYGFFYSQDRVFWELGATQRANFLVFDPIQLNSYAYARNNPLIYVDPSGELIDYSNILNDEATGRDYYKATGLTTDEAWEHYKSKKGIDLQISINEVDFNSINIKNIEKISNLVKAGDIGEYDIDEKIAVSTNGASSLILGNITARVQGKLSISEGKWNFTGTQKFFDDVYDFGGAKEHRSILGNILTIVGDKYSGTPYNVQIRGKNDITDSGKINNVKETTSGNQTNYLKAIINNLFK